MRRGALPAGRAVAGTPPTHGSVPWVQAKNLASHALALAAYEMPADWHKLYRSRPVMLEAYVNLEQHVGTCCKAAGRHLLGLIAGRKMHGRRPAQAPKRVRALPLRRSLRTNTAQGAALGRNGPTGPPRPGCAPATGCGCSAAAT